MNAQPIENTLADLVVQLARYGFAWARHGLAIGASACRAAADTLDVTSDLLGKRRPPEGPETEPPPADPGSQGDVAAPMPSRVPDLSANSSK